MRRQQKLSASAACVLIETDLPSFCNAAWLRYRTTITINHTSLNTSKCRLNTMTLPLRTHGHVDE